MGRIRTLLTKRLGKQIVQLYRPELNTNFKENKVIVADRLVGATSKKLRNTVTGYVTRLMKVPEE